MAFDPATVDTFLTRRRRFGRSETAALVAASLALAVGAAAWLTEADSAVAESTADISSFEDRYVAPADRFAAPSSAELFRIRPALQPLDRTALAALQTKWRNARDELTQGLASSEWRTALGPDRTATASDGRPAATAATTDVPLPRSRPAAADMQMAAAEPQPAAPQPESRSMLQKFSDLLPSKMTLASLTPFQRGPDLAALGYDNQTAVYDISARAVYLPNGSTLEAHSGLGQLRDDPDHVDQHNVGATPPATYELKPREQLFHGVRALRMVPTDGSSTLGRQGLLAHSYMLGPEGDSNGCVSIRDYERFRKAFDEGEISRLVVVPSLGAVQQAAQRSTSQS